MLKGENCNLLTTLLPLDNMVFLSANHFDSILLFPPQMFKLCSQCQILPTAAKPSVCYYSSIQHNTDILETGDCLRAHAVQHIRSTVHQKSFGFGFTLRFSQTTEMLSATNSAETRDCSVSSPCMNFTAVHRLEMKLIPHKGTQGNMKGRIAERK